MRQLAGLLIVSVFVAASGLSLGSAEQSGTQTKSFPASRGGSLEVVVDGGEIVLVPWEKNEVFVRAEVDPSDVRFLKMTQNANTVRVQFRANGSDGDVRFEINLPSQFNTDLRTGGGNIEFRGALNGNLKAATGGGNVTLADVGGRIDVTTGGGNVETGKIQGQAVLQTGGGNIGVRSAGGDVEISTGGGNIEVGDVGKTLRVSTGGGNVALGDVGGTATVSTGGGNIGVGKVSGSAVLTTAGGNVDLRGASGTVKATSAGGDLTLRGISGSIEGATAGGNIHAELIAGGKGPSSLETAGGGIKLFLPENARVTIQALIQVRGRRNERRQYGIQSDFAHESYDNDTAGRGEIRATYKLNGGGETISLWSVNGNIEIRKGR